MPRIEARRRQIANKQIGFKYAAPIASLRVKDRVINFLPRRVILFHPRDRYSGSGVPGTIVDSYTAATLGIEVGDELTLALFDVNSGMSHDVKVTIETIGQNLPPWYINVAASELLAEFAFSDSNPLSSEQSITLTALIPEKCY